MCWSTDAERTCLCLVINEADEEDPGEDASSLQLAKRQRMKLASVYQNHRELLQRSADEAGSTVFGKVWKSFGVQSCRDFVATGFRVFTAQSRSMISTGPLPHHQQ